MIKKIPLTFIILLFFSSCGYSPIHSSQDSKKLNIEVISYDGDNFINARISSKLKIHDNEEEKLFKIKFTTNYTKKDLSKSLTGKIEEYQIEARTTYKIKGENVDKNFTINESFVMKNFDDDFEEKNYEERIKNNIADLNYRKLILQIYRLK